MKDSTDNHEIIEIYHKQAKAKKLSGDTQGAIDDYIKIIKLKPDDIVAYNNIGNWKHLLFKRLLLSCTFNV